MAELIRALNPTTTFEVSQRFGEDQWIVSANSVSRYVVLCECDTKEEADCVVMDLELAAAGKGSCADGAESLRAAKEAAA